MAKILTGDEIASIMGECRADGEDLGYTAGPEAFHKMPQQLGHGYGRAIQLRPGLWLQVMDVQKFATHVYHIQHSDTMPMVLSFYLSGGTRVSNNSFKQTEEEIAGKSYLYCLPNTEEIEEYPAKQRIRIVKVHILPELISTFSDRLQELPTNIKNAMECPEQASFYYRNQITPPQQHILQQLLQWPYQGITRQFYLEGKVLELLALYFDQILTKPIFQSKKLASKEIDRIYQARDILIQTMTNHPSLPELAKQVQINERKLKQGFHEVFDNTVFGYLHDHRMEQAQMLLQTGQLNIQETARLVGYASRSSFVVAFKKKFQLTPSQYLKSVN